MACLLGKGLPEEIQAIFGPFSDPTCPLWVGYSQEVGVIGSQVIKHLRYSVYTGEIWYGTILFEARSVSLIFLPILSDKKIGLLIFAA